MLLIASLSLQPLGVILGAHGCCGEDTPGAEQAEGVFVHAGHGCCGGADNGVAQDEPAPTPEDNDAPADQEGPCDCPMSCCMGKVAPTAPPHVAPRVAHSPAGAGLVAIASDAVRSPPHLTRLKRPPRVFTLA